MKPPGLRVFVISSSQLGARETDVANVVGLMSGPNVHHYWDGERRVGREISRLFDGYDQPAWDLWLLYRPGVVWGDDGAPRPDWWEHQLTVLKPAFGDRWLDADRFAAKAKQLAGR